MSTSHVRRQVRKMARGLADADNPSVSITVDPVDGPSFLVDDEPWIGHLHWSDGRDLWLSDVGFVYSADGRESAIKFSGLELFVWPPARAVAGGAEPAVARREKGDWLEVGAAGSGVLELPRLGWVFQDLYHLLRLVCRDLSATYTSPSK